MPFYNLENLTPVQKLWSDVKDGDIVAVFVGDVHNKSQYMGKKVRHITVGEPKKNSVVGFGGFVTMHFEPGETPVSTLDSYGEDKKVYVTVYE